LVPASTVSSNSMMLSLVSLRRAPLDKTRLRREGDSNPRSPAG
jgi:hypothetical protein